MLDVFVNIDLVLASGNNNVAKPFACEGTDVPL